MDLEKINRDSEDRAVWWAVGVTVLFGATMLLNAAFAQGEGHPLASRIAVLLALLFFGLAYGIYRGSRAAAIAVIVLFVLEAIAKYIAFGFLAMGPLWTAIFGVILWAGMRGVFAQASRPQQPRRTAHGGEASRRS
jgi:hypothetical protein